MISTPNSTVSTLLKSVLGNFQPKLLQPTMELNIFISEGSLTDDAEMKTHFHLLSYGIMMQQIRSFYSHHLILQVEAIRPAIPFL